MRNENKGKKKKGQGARRNFLNERKVTLFYINLAWAEKLSIVSFLN